MSFTKFVLSTANLGAVNGINNQEKYNGDLLRKMISYALTRGILTFDTSAEYGNAKEFLGTTLKPEANHKVVSKIPTRDSYSYVYVS